MALSTHMGTGTTLSSNYYMRNFYVSHRDARTASKRRDMANSELTLADGMALRRAIKKLGSYEFDSENDVDIRNTVKAYIDTYNNALSSTSHSTDRMLQRNMKQLKSIVQESSSDLDKIGITVNSDGSLTQRESLFSSAKLSKFEKLFSKDSDFMQRTAACARRIEKRSEALSLTQKNQHLSESAASQTNITSDIVTAAQQNSNHTDLDTLLHTGIGQNVNIVL